MTDELSKGFTGIEINGVRFSNVREMLVYMNKQRDQLTKATEIIKGLYFIIQSRIDYENNTGLADEMWRAEQFIKEI